MSFVTKSFVNILGAALFGPVNLLIGRQLERLDFIFKDSDQIQEAQLIQDELDHLTVKVVRRDNYTQVDEVELRNGLRGYLGDKIRIDLDYVKEVPREANGKFRQIISKGFKDRYKQSNVDTNRS